MNQLSQCICHPANVDVGHLTLADTAARQALPRSACLAPLAIYVVAANRYSTTLLSSSLCQCAIKTEIKKQINKVGSAWTEALTQTHSVYSCVP